MPNPFARFFLLLSRPLVTVHTFMVARALHAFHTAHSWEEARAILEHDEKLLLSETADQLLTALIASAHRKGNTSTARALEIYRTLLRHAREVGIPAACAEFEAAMREAKQREKLLEDQPQGLGFPPTHRETEDIAQSFPYLANQQNPRPDSRNSASSQDQRRQIVARMHQQTTRHGQDSEVDTEMAVSMPETSLSPVSPEEASSMLEDEEIPLLSDTSDQLITMIIATARLRGDHYKALYYELYRTMLRRARTIGVAAAKREIDVSAAFFISEETVMTWLDTHVIREHRRFLETHQELLNPLTDSILYMLIERSAGQPEQVEYIRHLLPLLHDIRRRGGTIEAIREGYVNTHGGLFVLDLPSWLQDLVEHQFIKLRQANQPSRTAAARVALLGDILNRIGQDTSIAPEVVAELQHELGMALREDPQASRTQALQAALTAGHATLEVYTLDRYPRNYAMAQAGLGNTYRELIANSRQKNLERAIACYREALRVYTLVDFPTDYASVQNNLGLAYRERITGSQRENQEEAIACYREALRVYTLVDYPREYAMAQTNLGGVYQERITGSQRENQEEAIACYREALRVYTLVDFSQQYGSVQNNLGLAYRERIAGNRRQNLEEAIACYREALRVYTLVDYPRDYAGTQTSLGFVYTNRIVGDRLENLEEAIACCREALRVSTLTDSPQEYAEAQANLGLAYTDRIAGNRRENLEEAIACYHEALRVYTLTDFPTRYAATQNSLGIVYTDRIAGNRRENLEEAIACYHEALRVATLADSPVHFRNTQINVAWLAYDALAPQAEARGDTEGAQKAYQLAHDAYAAARLAQAELGWLESEAVGRASLRGQNGAVRELYARDAWCLWRLGRLTEAVVALEAGRAQALVEAQAIVNASLEGVCETHREEFTARRQALQEAHNYGERISLRAARDNFLAVRQVIRTHCQPDFLPDEPDYHSIVEAAAPDQAIVFLAAMDRGSLAFVVPPIQGPMDANARTPIAIPLPELTLRVVFGWLERRQTGEGLVGGLRVALNHNGTQVVWNWAHKGEKAEQARRLALPLREVASLLPGPIDLAMLRLIKSWSSTPHLLELPLGEVLANKILEGDLNWFLLETELDRLLPQLGELIMSPLRRSLDALGLDVPTQPIALIACGWLGLLPLHAAPVLGRQMGHPTPFQETCELTYQPSARTLAVARRAGEALPSAGPVLAVGDPQPQPQRIARGNQGEFEVETVVSIAKLEWAEAEAEAVARLAKQAGRIGSKALLGAEATLPRIRRELATIQEQHAGVLIEIAGHGHTDPTDPTNCYMLLSNGERLTLADLQRARLLEGVRCFNASGCVTGLGDMETAPDELSSFAAGVLQAGSACAIATLWSVSDRATFLLMLRFHQLLFGDPTMTPARALRGAARWLRGATRSELDELARAGLAGLRPIPGEGTDRERDALRGIILREETEAAVPEQLRFPAAIALGKFRLVGPQERGREIPYSHPIYWASAFVYGA